MATVSDVDAEHRGVAPAPQEWIGDYIGIVLAKTLNTSEERLADQAPLSYGETATADMKRRMPTRALLHRRRDHHPSEGPSKKPERAVRQMTANHETVKASIVPT